MSSTPNWYPAHEQNIATHWIQSQPKPVEWPPGNLHWGGGGEYYVTPDTNQDMYNHVDDVSISCPVRDIIVRDMHQTTYDNAVLAHSGKQGHGSVQASICIIMVWLIPLLSDGIQRFDQTKREPSIIESDLASEQIEFW